MRKTKSRTTMKTSTAGKNYTSNVKFVLNNVGTKENPDLVVKKKKDRTTTTDPLTGKKKTTLTKTNASGVVKTRKALISAKSKAEKWGY